VNQVVNMTTMSGNFFSTNCDIVDYSIVHILLSCCRHEWIVLWNPLLLAQIFRKNRFLRYPQRRYHDGVHKPDTVVNN
jgi:hypothetical protein